MADDIRIMRWEIITTSTRQASAVVNITDYLRWAQEEHRGQEMNDLSVDDFMEYMTMYGPKYTTEPPDDIEEWQNVEEDR